MFKFHGFRVELPHKNLEEELQRTTPKASRYVLSCLTPPIAKRVSKVNQSFESEAVCRKASTRDPYPPWKTGQDFPRAAPLVRLGPPGLRWSSPSIGSSSFSHWLQLCIYLLSTSPSNYLFYLLYFIICIKQILSIEHHFHIKYDAIIQ